MYQRVILEPSFVLHTRSFRDTSLLVDLFTLNHGRISALARGARTINSRFRGVLRAFIPILTTWSGKTELMNLSVAESAGTPFEFSGTRLLIGLYLNELLVKLLHQNDPYPQLFMLYQKTLSHLQNDQQYEFALRLFEKQLLAELGYGVSFDRDNIGEPIFPDIGYLFQPGIGFIQCREPQKNDPVFLGKNIMAIHENQFDAPEILYAAKKIMRMAIAMFLQQRTIKTRELFIER